MPQVKMGNGATTDLSMEQLASLVALLHGKGVGLSQSSDGARDRVRDDSRRRAATHDIPSDLTTEAREYVERVRKLDTEAVRNWNLENPNATAKQLAKELLQFDLTPYGSKEFPYAVTYNLIRRERPDRRKRGQG